MAPHAGQFFYDAKTSSFRLAGDRSRDDQGKRRDVASETSAKRQLRRPDQFLYSAKTSSFYLLDDGAPDADDTVSYEFASESATLSCIESEKKRHDAERSGASAGVLTNLPAQTSITTRPPFLDEPAQSGSDEIHHFMSKLWGVKQKESNSKDKSRKAAAASSAKDTPVQRTHDTPTDKTNIHRALAAQYKARAEIAEEQAAQAWGLVHRLERQGLAAEAAQAELQGMFDGKAAQLEAANQRIALLDKQLAATQAQLKQLEDRNIQQGMKRKQQEQTRPPALEHASATRPEQGLVAPLAVTSGAAGGGCETETLANEEVRRDDVVRRGALEAQQAARRPDKLDKAAILKRIFSEEEKEEHSGQDTAAIAGRAGADGQGAAAIAGCAGAGGQGTAAIAGRAAAGGSANALLQVGPCLFFSRCHGGKGTLIRELIARMWIVMHLVGA